MSNWVELSTILAAVAGMWALSLAWWTYVAAQKEKIGRRMSVFKALSADFKASSIS